jgi:nicotinamidase-related amidase
MTNVPPSPRTLLQIAGASPAPPRLSEAVLVLIDYQQEYTTGTLPLTGVEAAVDEAAALLNRARAAKTPVIHVAHKGRPGGLFDREAAGGAFIAAMTPQPGETVVEKGLPNSYAGTTLADVLAPLAERRLIVIGFMTHMCVSATVRSALDHGTIATVVAAACATRDLPNPAGGVMPARTLHEAALAALGDRFALVVPGAGDIPD